MIKNILHFLRIKRKPYWNTLWNAESDNSNWEIWHHEKKKEITLQYIPEGDYSKNDIKIKMSYEHFDDLVDFLKRLDEKYY